MSAATGAYTGYKAYQYLEAGRDYEDFELVPELNRVPSSDGLELSTDQDERARRLLSESLVISLHDHPSVLPKDLSRYRDLTRTGRDRMGYEALAGSGLSAIFDNFLACSTYITSQAGWKWTDVVVDIGMRLCDLAHQDLIVCAGTVNEIVQAQEQGKIALIPALEAAAMIENEVDRIDVLYGFGIRQMGIAYSEANTLGAGLKERRDGGLTYFGERAIRRMNKLGMAIDTSHCGDQTNLDVIRLSEVPVFITHAGARSVWPSRRMKPDEVIRECAERGGIVGIEAAPHTTLSREHRIHSLLSVMDHFTYIADMVGIEHVAFGPDTIFGDHVALLEAEKTWQYDDDPFRVTQAATSGDSPATLDYPRVEFVGGLENPAECFRSIIRWLVLNGYSDEEVKLVVGGNIIRTLEAVWI
jgi:membrane dipeptidase